MYETLSVCDKTLPSLIRIWYKAFTVYLEVLMPFQCCCLSFNTLVVYTGSALKGSKNDHLQHGFMATCGKAPLKVLLAEEDEQVLMYHDLSTNCQMRSYSYGD